VSTAQVQALFAGGSWFDASNYNVDGVSGKVGSFIDQLDGTHTLAQATSAQQVAVPAAHADYAGALAATFAGSQRYQSNRAAASWTYLHSGLGLELWSVYTITSTTACALMATGGLAGLAGGSQTGLSHSCSAASNAILLRVANGSANCINSGPASGAVTNIPLYTEVQMLVSGTPDYNVRMRDTSLATGDATAALSSGAPTNTFMLGADGAGGFGFLGRWRMTAMAPVTFTAAQRTLMQTYIRQQFGILP